MIIIIDPRVAWREEGECSWDGHEKSYKEERLQEAANQHSRQSHSRGLAKQPCAYTYYTVILFRYHSWPTIRSLQLSLVWIFMILTMPAFACAAIVEEHDCYVALSECRSNSGARSSPKTGSGRRLIHVLLEQGFHQRYVQSAINVR